MAIPDNPNWSALTNVKPYPSYDLTPINADGVHAISAGPQELNNSQGVLTSRNWLATQESGQIIIRGQINV